VARGIVSSSGLTAAGQFFGTPDYAAPEQMTGQPVDGRLDQYSLACVTYTLLAGSAPFKRDEPMAVLYAHLYKPPPRLTAVRPDLPAAVDRVLARGLAKEPRERYDSCGDFADALREALGLEPYDPSRPASPASQSFGVPYGGPQPSATAPMTPPDSLAAARAPVVAALPTTTADQALPAPPVTWTAVVGADRAYYDSVRPVNEKDTASISFPATITERRFPLSGTELRIGRRSVSRHIEPEIDLTGPPTDPGVSRLHAVLRAGPDRSWSVMDSGSPNGIAVNGKDVPPGESVRLRDGDRIHLGAWTVITITRG
jgi:serine/threonine protein kinase